MSEKYSANNPKSTNSTTRAGEYKTNYVKSSTFLPGTFNTELNRKWLDSTLDQMLSKGELDDVNAYVGSIRGHIRNANDTYLSSDPHLDKKLKTSLTPAAISTNSLGKLTHVMSFDDVSNNVQNTFDTYNYGAAYSTAVYTFAPPIDIDKFVNYESYLWVPDMPVYVSARVESFSFDEVTGNETYYWVDGENEFWLQDGQRIKMAGFGYDDNVQECIYIVTGVGKSIELIQLTDKLGNIVYPLQTAQSPVSVAGIWDLLEYNKGNWDSNGIKIKTDDKDYIVIDRADKKHTAWSRNNHWVHRDTVFEMIRLTRGTANVLDLSRRSKRPIVEFNTDLVLMNHSTTGKFQGTIGFLLNSISDIPQYVSEGTRIAFVNNPNIYNIVNGQVDLNNPVGVMENEDTAVIANPVVFSDTYEYIDVHFKDGNWKLPQQKTAMNQPPLFDLFTADNISLSDFNETSFSGSKIFGYKLGTGTPDPQLGFPIVRKDSPTGAEIVFENFLHTETHSHRILIEDTFVERTPINGYYYYNQNNKLKTSLEQRRKPLISQRHEQIIVGDVNNVQFAKGYDSWDHERELIIGHSGNLDWTVTDLFTSGIYSGSNEHSPELILATAKTYSFHNLLAGYAVVLHDKNETPLYVDGYSDVEFDIEMSYSVGTTKHVSVVDVNNNIFGQQGKIHIVADDSNYYHNIKINGKRLPITEYIINADTIQIDSDKVSSGDIIDFEYYSNDSINSSNLEVPEILTSNVHNKLPTEFTLSETVSHWTSIIQNYPWFEGSANGYNTAHRVPKVNAYGGEISIQADSAIPYIITLSDKMLNAPAAIYEQAREWWSFKQRVISQVRRLWASTSYASVRELSNAAINAVLINRKNVDVNTNSNMLYAADKNEQQYSLDIGQTTIVLDSNRQFNGLKQDHIYVYLADEFNGTIAERLLTENIDYRITGNILTLYVNVTSDYAIATVYQYSSHDASYVPASLTKLGLQPLVEPTVDRGNLLGHDGTVYSINDGVESIHDSLVDINGQYFNPIAAVLYDIENRVYSGVTKSDVYANTTEFTPSQHNSRWYSNLDHIENQYMYKYYLQWLSQTGATASTEYPDATDTEGWTWNYSGTDYGGHIGTDVPGYWEGAYHVLFGTTRPHITPWEMLGYGIKPIWWDNYYGWTDANKRAALISALRRGDTYRITSTTPSSNHRHARYYWDWDSRCPVNTLGELELPKNVLIEDANDRILNVSRAQPFKFNDWSPAQMVWRNTPLAHATRLNAIMSLQPAQAWTSMFHVNSSELKPETGIRVNSLTQKVNSIDNSVLSGTTGFAVKSINVTSTTGIPNSQVVVDPSNTCIEIINGNPIIPARAAYTLDASNRIASIELLDSGFGYDETPELVVVTSSGSKLFIDVEIQMTTLEYDALGLDTVLRNFVLRNYYDVDSVEVFGNLDTRLAQKIGGFTSKHLISFKTDSNILGTKTIGDSDYDLVMYSGFPTDLITASSVKVTKHNDGYEVSGYSPNAQVFYFYEPNVTNPSAYSNVEITSGGITVRRYNNFSSVVSTVEYGAKFNKIQDLYNFMRGQLAYLEDTGFTFDTQYDVTAKDAASWAYAANINETITIGFGSKVTYTPAHGAVLEINTLPNQANSVIDFQGRTVDTSEIIVTRTTDSAIVQMRNDLVEMGSITFATADYEHAAIFKRKTTFNGVIFDDLLHNKFERFKVEGQRTADWHGERHAPGFLVFDDKIIQNWDSSVDEIRDYYDTNVTKFNAGIEKAERITNGNIPNELMLNSGLSQNTINEFYKGIIKDKGTNYSIDAINNSNIINQGNSTVTHNEVWMFRNKLFGNVGNTNAVEILLRNNEFKSNPQVLYFNNTNDDLSLGNNVLEIKQGDVLEGNDPRYVNYGEVSFETAPFTSDKRELSFKTAGDPIPGETEFEVFDLDSVVDIFDKIEKIDTWNTRNSYKLNDRVRLNGKVYQCNVDATGLNLVGSNVAITGAIRYPTMPYGSIGIFRSNQDANFVKVDFGESNLAIDGINVIGSEVSPIVYSKDGIGLTIDGNFVSLEQKELVEIPSDYPFFIGSAFPEITNALVSRYLNINNVQIDLADTGAPIVPNETILVDGTTTSIRLDQNIGPYLPNRAFDIAVSTVLLDGVELIEGTDYTISENNNTIIFTTAPSSVTDRYIELGYVVDDYVVNGTASLLVTYNVINYKDFNAIQEAIESAVNNVTVSLENNRLVIRGTEQGPTAEMIIDVGTANAELGLVPGTYTGGTSIIYEHVQMFLDDVISAINNAALSGVTASNTGDRLAITSSNSTLTILGTSSALTELGIVAGQRTAESVSVNAASGLDSIVIKLNTAFATSATGMVAANVDGYLVIASTTDYLEIGGLQFVNNVGFEVNNVIVGGTYDNEDSAIYNTLDVRIANTFDIAEWIDVTYDDPASTTVWVSDDSSFGYASLGSLQVRNNGWNVYKFMDFGYYSVSDDECCVCAGNATSDGNDAEITMYKEGVPVSHGLQIGDYVMVLNSTTVPSVDGIHKVTKINANDSTKFYIDMYIEECGVTPKILVMRSMRFKNKEEIETGIASTQYYRFGSNENVFATSDENNNPATVVYKTPVVEGNDTVTDIIPTPSRITYKRTTNKDIQSISFYDGVAKETQLELEVYDPLMGLIPGIADNEINYKSPVDFAVYSDSLDTEYQGNYEDAWGKSQVGQVWWDTSKLCFYDYSQGSIEYRSKMWGKLSAGSSVDIYEWVRSDIPPEEWESSKDNETLGIVVSGIPYSVYDKNLDETLYYYTQIEEWDITLGKYITVYYFWVKNKTTLESTNRQLTSLQIASIIQNPTGYGISWCAAIDENAMIIANVQQFTNNVNTVMQMNRNSTAHSHRSWTAIAENADTIPEYWYLGVRDNLVGYSTVSISHDNSQVQEWNNNVYYNIGAVVKYDNNFYNCSKRPITSDSFAIQKLKGCWAIQDTLLLTNRFPNPVLHRFNRYGDDRSIGQGWFKDIFGARREAITIANKFLKTMNLVENIGSEWDTRLIKYQHVWDWTDYVTSARVPEQKPSLTITNAGQLASIDNTRHTLVRVLMKDRVYGRDVSELHQWNGAEWDMVEKKNASIQFNDFLWNDTSLASWDMSDWDNKPWDNDDIQAMYIIIEALRHDLFIKEYVGYFNKWWFGIINYVLSEHNYIDWLYKTTYITVNIETPLEQPRVYQRNKLNEVVGYINTVKPFHTKIKSLYDQYIATETSSSTGNAVALSIQDILKSSITINMTNNTVLSDVVSYVAPGFTDTWDDNQIIGLSFSESDTSNAPVLDSGDLLQPGVVSPNYFDMGYKEHLALLAITKEPVFGQERHALLLQDNDNVKRAYLLDVSQSSTVTNLVDEFADTIEVIDGSMFSDSGYAYVNGEVFYYAQRSGNQLMYIDRAEYNTFAKIHRENAVVYNLSSTESALDATFENIVL